MNTHKHPPDAAPATGGGAVAAGRPGWVLALLTSLLGLAMATPAHALTTITRDTRIDARHSLADDVLVRADPHGHSPRVEIVTGGAIRGWLIADAHSVITLAGGTIGGHLIAREQSQVTVAGGSIAMSLFANDQSRVQISGGAVGLDLRARDQSRITVTGGVLGADLAVYDRARLTVAGGLLGGDLFAFGRSTLTLAGDTMQGRLYAMETSTVRWLERQQRFGPAERATGLLPRPGFRSALPEEREA